LNKEKVTQKPLSERLATLLIVRFDLRFRNSGGSLEGFRGFITAALDVGIRVFDRYIAIRMPQPASVTNL